MKRDFKFWLILLAFSLPVCAGLFIGTIYFSNCGINADCSRGFLAPVIHTPIPTLIPATLPAPTLSGPIRISLSPLLQRRPAAKKYRNPPSPACRALPST